MALAFPNTYYTGMSNLGFQSIYGLLNSFPDVVCERFFLPDRRSAAEYVRTGTPLLSLESGRPLKDFELAAFSLSYENDYPGLVRMLRMSGLAARRDDRRESDPLVIAGGVCVRTNPEPLAGFLDLALLGDGEVIIPALIQAWRETRSNPLPPVERVFHLAGMTPGAYAPGFYKAALDDKGRLENFFPTRKGSPESVKSSPAQTMPDPAISTQILTSETEFAGTRLVEIGRGCPRGCRFCLAGFVYRPPRFASAGAIYRALGEPSDKGDRVGLVSPAVADHPEIEQIVQNLVGQGREVTVSSLRVETITPGLAEALFKGKQRSAAIAPEAGSQNLRNCINKNLKEEQILDGAQILAEAGVKRLKLYFMIGLPNETRDDVKAIPELTGKIKDRMLRSAKGKGLTPEVTLSVASFVPKPFTPFETQPMLETNELKNRAKLIKSGLKNRKGLRVHFDIPKWARLQALFSRGDRRVGDLIEALAGQEGGLSRIMKEMSFNPDFFVTRSMAEDRLLPWSFIDHGFKKGYLDSELKRAEQGRLSPACKTDVCRTCGVCPGDQ